MPASFNPIPSSIQISRMLRRPPPVKVPFTPMIKSPTPRIPKIMRADGGPIPDHPMLPVTGGIGTSDPGRGDQTPVHVPPGSYVLPADAVSHIGQGNTLNGLAILKKMFLPIESQSRNPLALMRQGAPYGGAGAPYGAGPKVPVGKGIGMPRGIQPGISGEPRFNVSMSPMGQQSPVFSQTAHGGVVPGQAGAQFLDRMGVGHRPGTPINISGGEFVVPPEEVKRRGRGDINRGHEILDAWVRHLRADHIKTLKNLPGPAQ